MKRKFLCIALCLCTLVTMLAGCGEKKVEDEDLMKETSVRTAASVNMWVITDKKTTPEAEELVEAAFNEITKTRFTTYVDLIFLTEDEYKEQLTARFTAIEDAERAAEEAKKLAKQEAQSLKAAGITTVAQTTTTVVTSETAEETILNQYGVVELKYPEIPDSQIDIILVKGYEELNELVAASRLTKLDSEISSTGSSKALTDYINAAFFDYTKVNGSTFAIPNNHVLGEYTYLLINKTLADKYYINPDTISTFSDCEKFIEDVKKNETVAPVKGNIDPLTSYFWDSDLSSPDFSVVASTFSLSAKQSKAEKSNVKFPVVNPFSIPAYTSHILLMQKYKEEGYFAANSNDDFAVAVVKGDYALRNEYSEDYYVKVLRKPVAYEDDLYQSFFAVSSYTGNLSRSMEIITFLNSDPSLRNILQYGIEDVHFSLDDNGLLYRLNDDYLMNINDTGNVFMAYPEEGMAADVWDNGKLQNLDAGAFPLLGIKEVWGNVDKDLMSRIDALSAEYAKRLAACKTYAEIEEFFAAAKAEITQNEDYKAAVNQMDSTTSLAAVYKEWYDRLWPTVE